MSTVDHFTSRSGPGCIMLFSLPFAAVGVGMAIWLGMEIYGHLEAQHWEEVPARIVRADLKVHHGDKSTTYEATAEYAAPPDPRGEPRAAEDIPVRGDS